MTRVSHGAGSRSVFRLPPPIPGLPGGGYPQEWTDAAMIIQRNYTVHLARKKANNMEVRRPFNDRTTATDTLFIKEPVSCL